MKKLKRDYILLGMAFGIAFSMIIFAILTIIDYL